MATPSKFYTPSDIAKIYTNGQYLTPPHIQLLERTMLKVANGTIKRLIVTMPPRHGKSEYISKFFPAWYLLTHSQKRIILASYESSFAGTWSAKAREVYRYFRQDLHISRNDHWENIRGSAMYATGAGGSITGRGADIFIIDDPYKNHIAANSPTQRKSVWDWFVSTAESRIEPEGRIVLLQTRWHFDDLAGQLIREEGDKWTIINLPALAGINDPLGRKEGEALWPQRFDVAALEEKKKRGSYWFSALYQQQPIATENQIVPSEWLKYGHPDGNGFTIQSWDTASGEKKQNDYSVCTTFKVVGTNIYLVDAFRRRLPYPDLLRHTQELYNKYKPNIVLIEDTSAGTSIIQTLRNSGIPIKPIKPKVDKVTRLQEVSPLFEAGYVYFFPDIDKDLIVELNNFPFDPHDDFVDSLSQGLTYAQTQRIQKAVFTTSPKLSNYFTYNL